MKCRLSVDRRGVLLPALSVWVACSSAGPSPTHFTPPMCAAGEPLCRLLIVEGDEPAAEIGFRFGQPRDVDGDGFPDVAAGGRFAERDGRQVGSVSVWSGRDGQRLARWYGDQDGGLFGNAVLLVPDIDGDGLADMVLSAPQIRDEGGAYGEVTARAGLTGEVLWRTTGQPPMNFGWDFDLTDDHTGDGVAELLVGAPVGTSGGSVALVDGAQGTVLQRYQGDETYPMFGWYVASIEDLDGDGLADVLIGAPEASPQGRARAGAALVLSSATGRQLLRLFGPRPGALLGEVVAAVSDLSGDGQQDIAVSATHSRAGEGPLAGQVVFYDSSTGEILQTLEGRQEGERYGRFVGRVGDIDGDGIEDIAIGAPWAGDARQGRFELRSGRDLSLLAERAGREPEDWLGWHIVPAPLPAALGGEPGLLVSALRRGHGELFAAGALEWYTIAQTL